MANLAGRKALVTGGGSGVGLAIARSLTGAGAKVCIAGRNKAQLEQARNDGAAAAFQVSDVTDEASVTDLFARAGNFDIVIANAGVATSSPIAKTSLEQWSEIVAVNLTGAFLTFREAMKSMATRDWGRLIAISSTAGLRGYSYVAPYCAAKHGVVGLVRALAQETARSGITVNAVCPGYTETPMLYRTIENIIAKTGRSEEEVRKTLLTGNPQQKFIQPAEVAEAVLWLCGPGSGPVTGQAISISGGETW